MFSPTFIRQMGQMCDPGSVKWMGLFILNMESGSGQRCWCLEQGCKWFNPGMGFALWIHTYVLNLGLGGKH